MRLPKSGGLQGVETVDEGNLERVLVSKSVETNVDNVENDETRNRNQLRRARENCGGSLLRHMGRKWHDTPADPLNMRLSYVPAQGAKEREHKRNGHAANTGQCNGFNHATMKCTERAILGREQP